MRKRKGYIAVSLHPSHITLDGEKTEIELPDKCIGIMFVFKTKTAARKYWGKNVELIQIESETNNEI